MLHINHHCLMHLHSFYSKILLRFIICSVRDTSNIEGRLDLHLLWIVTVNKTQFRRQVTLRYIMLGLKTGNDVHVQTCLVKLFLDAGSYVTLC